MIRSSLPGAVVIAVALAALSVSCGAGDASGTGGAPGSGGSVSASASSSAAVPGGTTAPSSTPPSVESSASGPATPSAERVRDAFAGLQATLDDSCTPGNCAYFLGRVHDELQRMDRAMKADPKGPGHFPEPIALIAKLNRELDGDRSFENLKKHQSLLVGTRDEINTWMQGHPDDYR
ncbi:hypothetical protein [Streptomyces lateritius]|uniref:hypothetical protein n=1 Tax=Streptomyces lateritius TaxID=67313 RepID=UPI001C8B471E|nr:hypothetical protein [Streptomyces lateritius]MBX9422923.1 hypothetical protein [Streptomyces lateritius]